MFCTILYYHNGKYVVSACELRRSAAISVTLFKRMENKQHHDWACERMRWTYV